MWKKFNFQPSPSKYKTTDIYFKMTYNWSPFNTNCTGQKATPGWWDASQVTHCCRISSVNISIIYPYRKVIEGGWQADENLYI